MAKNKKRVKSNQSPLIPINDWTGADEVLRKMIDLQANVQQREDDAQARINEIKADLVASVDDMNAQIKTCVRSLEAFAATHRKDLGQKKSKLLNFGTIGWRLSTSIRIKQTTLTLIKQVFSRAKAKQCIRLKETVDKEALAKLTDDKLAEVGAQRKIKDVFFAEPSTVEAADHEGKRND